MRVGGWFCSLSLVIRLMVIFNKGQKVVAWGWSILEGLAIVLFLDTLYLGQYKMKIAGIGWVLILSFGFKYFACINIDIQEQGLGR